MLACASHAVLSGQAVERLHNSRIEQVIVTDTMRPNPGPARGEVLLWDARTLTPDLQVQREAASLVRFLFLAHVADDDAIAEELRVEAETLLRPSQRDRRVPRAGPWLAAA